MTILESKINKSQEIYSNSSDCIVCTIHNLVHLNKYLTLNQKNTVVRKLIGVRDTLDSIAASANEIPRRRASLLGLSTLHSSSQVPLLSRLNFALVAFHHRRAIIHG